MTTTMLGRGWGPDRPRIHRIRASLGALAALTIIGAACAPSPDQSLQAQPGAPVPTPTTTVPPTTAPTTAPPATTPTTTTPTTTTSPGAPETVSFQAQGPISQVGGCEVFPANHYRNAAGVERLPVHPKSDQWLQGIGGGSAELRFPKARAWNGARTGMPINVVDSREVGFSSVEINWNWSPHSYRGKYPIPPNPRIEGHPSVQWDKHLIMLDTVDCTAYELIAYEPLMFTLFGMHTALNGSKYSLDTVVRPPGTTNSPNTPMVGQYVMVDDVRDRSVDHVLSWCTSLTGSEYLWPARDSDGTHGAGAVPMGAWIRLKDDVDTGAFTGDAKPVAEALAHHGAVLTDTCGHPFVLFGENSDQWDDAQMDQLRTLTAEDFEVVDSSGMIVDPATFEIR